MLRILIAIITVLFLIGCDGAAEIDGPDVISEPAGWARSWGGELSDYAWKVAVDSAGNAYVTGAIQGSVDFDPGNPGGAIGSDGFWDVFLCKLDSSLLAN